MTPRRPLALAVALTIPAALCFAAGACTDPAPVEEPVTISAVVRHELPFAGAHRNIDLLFVIDSSPAMAPHRARLLENYRRYVEILEAQPGGLPDLHIGVVTADVGTRGPNDVGPGPTIGTGAGACTSEGDRGELRRATAEGGTFLSDVVRPDGSRARNYAGSLADAVLGLADVGAAGCTYARPLEAMRRALAGNPANAGFLRPDAYLAVVLITAGDDCSFGSAAFTGGVLDRSRCEADPGGLVGLDAYVAFLRSLKDDPSQVLLVGGFAPAGAPACADVRPAARLTALLDAFPERADVASICEPDFSEPMSLLAQLLKVQLGVPCLGARPLDVDPARDGLQASCAAWYSYGHRGELVQENIPACRGDELVPCWQLADDLLRCPDTGLAIDLRDRRRGNFEPGADPRVIFECLTR